MVKFSWRRKPNFGSAVTAFVSLAITMWVGSKILVAVADSMADGTINVFSQAFELLGYAVAANGSISGTISTTGLIGVVGIVAAASVLLSFVKIKM